MKVPNNWRENPRQRQADRSLPSEEIDVVKMRAVEEESRRLKKLVADSAVRNRCAEADRLGKPSDDCTAATSRSGGGRQNRAASAKPVPSRPASARRFARVLRRIDDAALLLRFQEVAAERRCVG